MDASPRAPRLPTRAPLRGLAVALSLAGLARAQLLPDLDHTRASGDWGGLRSSWQARGVSVGVDYSAESFAHTRDAGERVLASYWGTLDAWLLAALGPLGLVPGGTLFVFAQHGHGEGPSRGLGLQMPASSLEAEPLTQLSELWYEQLLLGDRLRVKLGKQDGNSDFAASAYALDFLHSSFGVPPPMPLPSYPAPALGALVAVDPAPWLSLRAAVYDGRTPTLASRLELTFPQDSALLVASVVASHALDARGQSALGWSIGAWQHRGDVTLEQERFEQNYGVFALADVQLPMTSDAAATPLRLFVRGAWAPVDRNALNGYLGGGVTYRGVRTVDSVGLGVGRMALVGLGPLGAGNEAFAELFYKALLLPWLSLEPDLQVSVQRGPVEQTTLLAGLRLKLGL